MTPPATPSRAFASDPAAYGKVAVLMGGASPERDISLQSGRAAARALRARGIDADARDWRPPAAPVDPARCDRVFVALHGGAGEGGALQGWLEVCGLPYTGSGVAASALCLDKLLSKRVWRGAGLPTPDFVALRDAAELARAGDALGWPLFVKSVRGGSSIGVARMQQDDDPRAVWEAVGGAPAFAERLVAGGEYTVGFVGARVLPPIRIEPADGFYDYAAKYERDDTIFHCPCGLAADEADALRALADRARRALGARGWGRVDLMRDADGRAWLIEVNTTPGLTEHSLVPLAARHAGMDFEDLALAILDTAHRRGDG